MTLPICYFLGGGGDVIHLAEGQYASHTFCGEQTWMQANPAEVAYYPLCRSCVGRPT